MGWRIIIYSTWAHALQLLCNRPKTISYCCYSSICNIQSRTTGLRKCEPVPDSCSRQNVTQMLSTLVKVLLFGRWSILTSKVKFNFNLNLNLKSNFTSFWACLRDYLSSVQARVTKFGPKLHLSTTKIPIDLGVDRLWSLGSNLT